MEVNLKREAIQYCTPVYSDTLSREETLETVVSDTLPDVARILDRRGFGAAAKDRSGTSGQLFRGGRGHGGYRYTCRESLRIVGGRQAFKPAEDPVSRRGLRRGRGVSQRDGGAPDRGGADAGTLYAD